MKKTLLSLIMLSSIGIYSTQAQITINDTHLISAGDDVVQASDTLPTGVTIGASGANQTWDFSNVLDEDVLDTLKFRSPGGFPGNLDHPTANMVLADGDSSWTYLNKNTSGLFVVGISQYQQGQLISIPFGTTIISFPSTMGTAGSGVWNATLVGFDVSQLPLGLDSIKITRTTNASSNIDGWGTVQTPFATGGFAALRQIVLEESIDTTWEKNTSSGMWSIISPTTIAALTALSIPVTDISYDTTRTARWWTDDPSSKFPVVEMDYEANGTVTNVDWQKSSPTLGVPEKANAITGVLLYPNPAYSEITIETGLTNNHSIKILDVTGKLIADHSFRTNKILLSVADYSPGMYFYNIYDVNGNELYSNKFIVAK